MNTGSIRWLPCFVPLSIGAIFSAATVGLRFQRTGVFVFLLWNLFLAAVPYGVAQLADLSFRRRGRLGPVGAGLLLVWLLFFPNAPYMLTDLVHVGGSRNPLWWYDVMMLSTCAATAWLAGLVSLSRVHAILMRTWGERLAWIAIATVSWLAGFGVYLGRFLRFNSWDIASTPGRLGAEILRRFAHPTAHPRTHVFSVMFGALLLLSYALFAKLLNSRVANGNHAFGIEGGNQRLSPAPRRLLENPLRQDDDPGFGIR